MEATEFLKEVKRMCNYYTYCERCPAKTRDKCPRYTLSEELVPEMAVEVVEKWSKEHPRKTRLQDFMEKFPNAPLRNSQYPNNITPFMLGYCNGRTNCNECKYITRDLDFCWNLSLDEKV